MKKIMAVAVLFCLGAVKAHAVQQLDAYTDQGGINVQSNGQRAFSVGSQPSVDNALRVVNATGSASGLSPYSMVISTNGKTLLNADMGKLNDGPVSGLDLGVGNGSYFALRLSSRTAIQLGLQTPGPVGELIFNSTTGRVCVSTGSAQGAFANIASTSVVINNQANQVPCYGLGQ